tara:strand:+ start:72353 stop:72481 length:129 start_codon:yes stop_codon:yes gene_type:complete
LIGGNKVLEMIDLERFVYDGPDDEYQASGLVKGIAVADCDDV